LDRQPRRRATDHPRPRAVVTGAAGFLASHLSERLIDMGWDVVGLDNLLTGRMENISDLLGRPEFTFERLDVTNFVHVTGSVDAVLHFASPASPEDYLEHPIKTMKVGALGTHNTLGLALAKNARYLLASTSEVYGARSTPTAESYWGNVNPIGPRGVYDEAKRFAEALTLAYHRAHGLDVRIVRIFNTYGPRLRPADGRVVSNFLVQAMEGKPLTVYGNGDQTRSFCYVNDLITGIVGLPESDHRAMNIGNPNEFTILELARPCLEVTWIVVGSRSSHCPKTTRPAPTRHQPGLCGAGLEPEVQLRGPTCTYEWYRKERSDCGRHRRRTHRCVDRTTRSCTGSSRSSCP
jgi:dTDP-glucose 4,6-dehydratase